MNSRLPTPSFSLRSWPATRSQKHPSTATTACSCQVAIPAKEHATERKFTVTLDSSCGTDKSPAKLAVGISKAGAEKRRAARKAGPCYSFHELRFGGNG
jgi:hypothetical protein